ncbi:MAG: fibronectin type III domain-containing protein [Solirubrobacterales bacterium]
MASPRRARKRPAESAPQPSTVVTRAATEVKDSSARLNGAANRRTSYHFEYGTSRNSLGEKTPEARVGPGGKGVQAPISGLQPATRYFFRLVAGGQAGETKSFVTKRRAAPVPVATLIGPVGGAGIYTAGNAAATMAGIAMSTAAGEKAVRGTVAAVSATLRRIAAYRLARQREALQKAGFSTDAISTAIGYETELETIFQRRSTERLRAALDLAAQAPDTSARTSAIQSAVRRERNFSRQRAKASAGRIFAAVGRTSLEATSPEGAYWKLGEAAVHTPDCVAMAEKFWPWSILRIIHPLLHVGCKCRLYSYGEAIARGWMKPSDLMKPAEAARLAAPVIEWVERHHAVENEALGELLLREELAGVPGADLNFLAAAPLAVDAELNAEEDPDEEPVADPDDGGGD